MKKNLVVAAAVAASVCLMSSSAMAEENGALARIQESGKLVVATDAVWAPFEFMQGDEAIGVDIALAQDIADGLGVELEILNVAFDSLSMYLDSGEADLAMAAITITEDRKEACEFSEPYCDSSQYIIVKNDDENVTTIEDLAGYVIGVHLGTTGDFMMSDEVNMGTLVNTGASVQQYKDLAIASMGLEAGDVQAVVCDKQLAENLCVEFTDLKCFEAVYEDGTGTDEQYGIMAKKGETDLIAAVNEIVQPLYEDGTIDSYVVEYSAIASNAAEEETEEVTE